MFLMREGVSVKAKRGSSQEAENLLQTNPTLELRKYKVLQSDLGSAAVDKELNSVNEAGIA